MKNSKQISETMIETTPLPPPHQTNTDADSDSGLTVFRYGRLKYFILILVTYGYISHDKRNMFEPRDMRFSKRKGVLDHPSPEC